MALDNNGETVTFRAPSSFVVDNVRLSSSSSSTCLSISSRVRVIVLSDLVIALLHTTYRVAHLSLILREVFRTEKKLQTDKVQLETHREDLHLKKFTTVFLITAAVIGLAIEMFLFFLLNNGVRSKNYRHCKHWLITRTILLIFSILGSFIEYVRDEYSYVTGVLEIEKLYRIVALIVVRNFMNEVYKGRSDCNYQEYTSSMIDGYPNGGVPSGVVLRSYNSHSHMAL